MAVAFFQNNYYPYGLIMEGISSKSASNISNKQKYNGIEYTNDFDLNTYDAYFRSLDPQIGRWWQLDPRAVDEVSPYAAMMNNPMLMMDQLGDTTTYFDVDGNVLNKTWAKGYNNAFIINNSNVEGMKKLFSELGDLNLDKQKALDGAILALNVFFNIVDAYDLQSINKFYEENVNKNSINTIGGVEFSNMKDLKVDGKPVSKNFFNGIHGEASFDMIKKGGVWTVDEQSISTRNDLSSSAPGDEDNPNGHLHPNNSRLEGKTVSFSFNNGTSFYNNKFYRSAPPSGALGGRDIGKAADQNKMGGTKRNVVVNYDHIWLYHGASQGISINRK